MHAWRFTLIVVIVLGGLAVLISYAHGVITNPGKASALWGDVPQRLIPLYTASMLLAALGYFAFSYLLLFRVDVSALRMGLGTDFRLFIVLYAAILSASALWMPLTIQMVTQPTSLLWFSIRFVLVVVGIASLGVLGGLLTMQPRPEGVSYGLALVGSLIFFLHTAVLDALLWPAFFSR